MHGLRWAAEQGAAIAPSLGAVLEHAGAGMHAKVWAMMAIAQLGPGVKEAVHDVLLACLSDESPTVRRYAVRTLAALHDRSARDAIARLLSDQTLDPSAWWDDDVTVADAARAALAALQPDGKS